MLIAELKNRKRQLAHKASRDERYYCPGCHCKVILKRGTQKVAHFSHQRGGRCVVQGEPETQEHLSGKWQLQRQFKGELEVYLPEIAQRPDLLLRRDGGDVAIEFQCSTISPERFSQRNEGYRRLGIMAVWVFGEKFRQRFNTASGALTFLTFGKSGFELRFWSVRHQCLEVWRRCHVTLFNELRYEKWIWDDRGWRQIPVSFSKANDARGKLERQIMVGLKMRSHRILGWQKFCYWRHSLLQNLPDVCWPEGSIPPVLGASIVIWRKLLLVQLNAHCGSRGVSYNQLFRWSEQVNLLTGSPVAGCLDIKRAQFHLAMVFMKDLEAAHLFQRKNNRWMKVSA